MKYMLMFWIDESAGVTEDEDAAMMIAVKSWVEKMTERGVLRHGSPLCPVKDGKIVSVRDGEVLVTDGPFAETKEQIGGYDVLECADLGAAVQAAAAHPLARTAKVEVRPYWDAPWHRPPNRRRASPAGPEHPHGPRGASRRPEVPDQRPGC